MNTDSFRALRRANPRTRPDFSQAVEAAASSVRARISAEAKAYAPRASRRPALYAIAVGATLTAASLAAAFLAVSLPGGGPGVETASAAIERATVATAAVAEDSGTAVVRMTHGGELWAGKTIRWNGGDLAVSREEAAPPGRPATGMLLVDGVMYGFDPLEGGWFELGPPSSIDPGSGTTPAEYLAAVREDVGGTTLRRITAGMTGLVTRPLANGSTLYSGTLRAGLIARETGFKEGQAIRVLPFGYVAHDAAASSASPLDAAVTVGADGVIRQIALRWGAGADAWTYTVSYAELGATAALLAPKDARPLRRR
jgi:hypothetical protein